MSDAPAMDRPEDLHIGERIELLKIVKPITDPLRDKVSAHDINALNGRLIDVWLQLIASRETRARLDEIQECSDVVQENSHMERADLENALYWHFDERRERLSYIGGQPQDDSK